jgi:outer membrane protein assembly factor BamB
MNVSSKKFSFISLLSLLVVGIFAVSFSPAARAASALTPDQANWQYVNHDSNGTNVNPETQIDSSNAPTLQVKWIFPYPGSDATAPGLKAIAFTPGAADPPLVVNGIVYSMTNNMILYALNAKDGSVIWQYQYSVNYTQALATIPITPAGGHIHGINYLPASNGQPAVVSFTGMICDVNAVNALTGKIAWSIQNICSNVPGNPPGYLYRGYQDSHPPNVYVNGANGDGIVITAEAGGAPGTVPAARAFMAGYDLKTGALVWRTLTAPERPFGNTTFALQYCDRGYIEGVPCTQVISNPAIKTLFQNDWVNPKTGQIQFNVGSSGVWGFYPIDQKRGIVIMATSQASPDYNGTIRPGPNLFATTMFGLNASNGNVLWYFQSTTHDIWDYDCSWNGSLGHMTIAGAGHDVYVKTCKNGYVYALDELTGKPYWFESAPGAADRCGPLVGVPHPNGCNGKKGGYESLGDPLDPSTYTRGFISEATSGGAHPPVISNSLGAAFIENDHAWDVKNNVIYVALHNHPQNTTPTCSDTRLKGCSSSGSTNIDLPNIEHNFTISALNATNGNTLWSYVNHKLPFRGGVTVGGGPNPVVFAPGFDGNIYMLNGKTGALLGTKYLGTVLAVEMSIGATSDGNEQIYVQAGGGGATVAGFGYQNTPGVLVALGLPVGGAASASTTTVTSTAAGAVTTITSTAPGGAVTTVTSTAPGGVSTVVSTVSGGVSTTTVGSGGGVDTTTFYAVAGVAVIALIAAGFLGLRRGGRGGGA